MTEIGDYIHHLDFSYGYITEELLPGVYLAVFNRGGERIIKEGEFHNCTKSGIY